MFQFFDVHVQKWLFRPKVFEIAIFRWKFDNFDFKTVKLENCSVNWTILSSKILSIKRQAKMSDFDEKLISAVWNEFLIGNYSEILKIQNKDLFFFKKWMFSMWNWFYPFATTFERLILNDNLRSKNESSAKSRIFE